MINRFIVLIYCFIELTGCFFPKNSLFSINEHPFNHQPYEAVISLGDICQVAHQLTLHEVRGSAYPFDWIFTPFESLYTFLTYEGLFFLDKDKLIFINDRPSYLNGSMKFIEDTVYHLQFLHDFELTPFFLKNYHDVKLKYGRRIKRLLDVLHSYKKVLFVRRCISYEQALSLDELLHKKYPQLNYTILALDSTEEIKTDWGIERVKNFYLRELTPWSWQGDESAWREILQQFYVLPSQPED